MQGACPYLPPPTTVLQHCHFGVWIGMWYIGGLGGKGGEVCDELRKRMIGVCCLQEVRWRGQGTEDERKEI